MKSNTLRRGIGLVALFLISLATWGQNEGFITLYGHVSDSETSASLDYASINLSGTNISNVSNLNGNFSLKIPEATDMETDVLVSYLGYQTGTKKVADFIGSTSSKPLEIKLIPTSILLDPVVVHATDPYELIRSAYYKVKDNYPTSRIGMTAFYREMIRKGTAKYLVLNEAVIDIDKAAYTGYASDKVGIYKGRGNTNYDTSDTIFVKYQGGIVTALGLDQVKNPLAGLTMDEAMEKYRFFMDGVETYDGHTFYKVRFKADDSVDEILYKGYIFIDVESHAIGRIEMEMDLEGREEDAARIFVLKSPRNLRISANKAEYVISYKCFDNRWYYDYCRADLNFSTRKKNSPFRSSFSITMEMAVTDHKTGGIAIEPASRVRFKDFLSDKVADFVDEDFWEDYNIIEPDQTIDAIIKRMARKLDRRK